MKFIPEKDWNGFLRKRNGAKKSYLYGMHVDEGILYLLADGRRDADYTEIISCRQQGKPKLFYEKKLNAFMKKYFVQDIVEGKFLCFNVTNDEYGDPLDDVLYDKKTNQSAVIHKKDNRRYYWNYNCYGAEWM